MTRRVPRRYFLGCVTAAPAIALGAAVEDPISAAMGRIKPLFRSKTPARPGEWLDTHHEAGQTYRQFRSPTRSRVVDAYSTLRLVPIGPLSAGQSAVLQVVIDFMQPFIGLPLAMNAPVALEEIPNHARRILYHQGPEQLLTSYLLQQVLMRRRRPQDAAVLGITAADLWPGAGWNFVFGQASLSERVGVWSMARNGDADERPAMRSLCAVRTAMTATHETGHMLGIRHCVAYQCGMNGSNSVAERDRQPMEFCPECQAKLWWTCGLDPLKRSQRLAAIAKQHGLERLATYWLRQSAVLAG